MRTSDGSIFRRGLLAVAVGALVAAPVRAEEVATDTFREALTKGRADVSLRYRFEEVQDGTPGKKDAHASTLRTAIGYSTGLWCGFGLQLQMEDVRVVGNELYNDGVNGKTDRATVVDPGGTELKQANLRYEGIARTVLRFGRQDIQHRDAPMHRYVGNVLWRQHWQSFDALRVSSEPVDKLKLDYAFAWNVNRIFGERNTAADASDYRVHAHLLNGVYTGIADVRIEPYAYLLDFRTTSSERFSTDTLGARVDVRPAIGPTTKVILTAEYARQADAGDNTNDIDVAYWLVEVGVARSMEGVVREWSLTASYEMLAGEGGVKAFQTPLGTNHAFQGWADRFLVTPGDGIQDVYLTGKLSILGATLVAVYRRFAADNLGYDYGDELDLLVEKTFDKRFTVGLKYSDYQADRNTTNVARNTSGGQAYDLEKVWAYVQVRF